MIFHTNEYDYTRPDGSVVHIGPDEIRNTDQRFGKYDSAMAEVLDTQCEEDEGTGSTEWAEYVGRYGKRLLFTDDRGFVTVERYDSVDAARARFKVIDAAYGEWLSAEDEDEDDSEV